MQNQILGFFILTTVALGILAASQWGVSRRLEMKATVSQRKIDDLNLNMDGQGVKAERLHASIGTLQAAISNLNQNAALLRTATNDLGQRLTKALNASVEDVSPEMQPVRVFDDAMGTWYRSSRERWMEDCYGEFLSKLDLDSQSIHPFKEALLELQRLNMLAKSGIYETTPDEAETAAQVQRMAAVQKRIEELLTPEQSKAFRAYTATLSDRLFLRPLRAELEASDHALTGQQFQRLIRVRADARQHLPPFPDDPTDEQALQEAWADRQSTIQKRLLSQASKFLDDPQVEALKRHQESRAD